MPSGTPIPQIQDPIQGTLGPYQLRSAPGQGGAGPVYIPPSLPTPDTIQGRYVPGEFEVYVNRLANTPPEAPIRRFGANLVTGIQLMTAAQSAVGSTATPTQATGTSATAAALGSVPVAVPFEAQDFNPQVPPDYVVQPGDEVLLTLWGSVDANLRLVVDRAGRISVPRVGAIPVENSRGSATIGKPPRSILSGSALARKSSRVMGQIVFGGMAAILYSRTG